MLDVLKNKILAQGLANVRTLPLQTETPWAGSYDMVVSNMTLHHVEHVHSMLAQFFKILKTPGYLCVADLDLEQGEFHENNAGVFHFGFDRALLRQALLEAGFVQVTETTAATVTKPSRTGSLRPFDVFLLVAKKDTGQSEGSR
jgi:2-polyprenyl-3-methyl-5-hydroxy-6-metoxy-1,4-benzoquinol methylase